MRFIAPSSSATLSHLRQICANAEAAVVVRQKLKRDNLKLYVRADNPIATRQALEKRLNVPGAWAEWERQTLDMRYAQMAGFEGLSLSAYYRRSVNELEKIPFKKSYGAELFASCRSFAEHEFR